MMRSGKLLLGVNIDHVATIRQARGASYPSILEAARIAEDLLPKHFQNSQDVFVPIMWLSHPRFREFRKDAAFKRLLTSLRLVDYWREEGWGDLCRPLGDHDFECN